MNADGSVTSLKAGETKLIVTTADAEQYEATIVVTEASTSAPAVKHSFVVVGAGKFYESAVVWAVENQVTNGIDATHFAPNDKCNWAQVVTFL